MNRTNSDPTSAAPPTVSPEGTKIGSYTVVRVLGAGGMGTVYLCRQAKPQRDVVIKFPHPALLDQEGFRERFEAEVQFIISLDHPGVVSIYETGIHGGSPYAVMQFLTGGSLGDRLKEKGSPQTIEEIATWLVPIAATLDSIHIDGVLHRDIKPDNILFDRRGTPYLADFGISKAIAEISGPSMALTRTGMIVGSPRYMPPEYIDRRFSTACDQYSLAAVAYFALTGHPPHESPTTERLLVDKATVAPEMASVHIEGLSPGAVLALNRALSIAPEDRFPNCTEFAAAFEAAAEATTEEISSPAQKQRPSFSRGYNPPNWWKAGALVALVVGVGLAASAWLRNDLNGPPPVQPDCGDSEMASGQSPFAEREESSDAKDGVLESPRRDVSVDPVSSVEYAIEDGGVVRIDPETGTSQQLDLPKGLSPISSPTGLAFDTNRRRLLLMTSGGKGCLYAYSASRSEWSIVSGMNNLEAIGLAYIPERDRPYTLTANRERKRIDTLVELTADGAVEKTIPLSQHLPFRHFRGLMNVNMKAEAGYLFAAIASPFQLIGDEYVPGQRATNAGVMYRIEPVSGQVTTAP